MNSTFPVLNDLLSKDSYWLYMAEPFQANMCYIFLKRYIVLGQV